MNETRKEWRKSEEGTEWDQKDLNETRRERMRSGGNEWNKKRMN